MEATASPDRARQVRHGMWAVGGRGVGRARRVRRRAGRRGDRADAAATAPGRASGCSSWPAAPAASALAAAELVAPDGEVVVLRRRAADDRDRRHPRRSRRAWRNVRTAGPRPRGHRRARRRLRRRGLPRGPDVRARSGPRGGRGAAGAAPGRPRGRVAVWGPRARNPWLGCVFDAVGAQLGAPVPPPGVPGPFALDDPDGLAALLRDAGLADVAVDELAVPPPARRSTTGGPARPRSPGRSPGMLRASMPRAMSRRASARSRAAAVAPYATATAGLSFPGLDARRDRLPRDSPARPDRRIHPTGGAWRPAAGRSLGERPHRAAPVSGEPDRSAP